MQNSKCIPHRKVSFSTRNDIVVYLLRIDVMTIRYSKVRKQIFAKASKLTLFMEETISASSSKALRVHPPKTRLTVYRRPRVLAANISFALGSFVRRKAFVTCTGFGQGKWLVEQSSFSSIRGAIPPQRASSRDW